MGLMSSTRRPRAFFKLHDVARRSCAAALVAGLALADAVALEAQSQRIEPAEVRCPSVLGVGVDTDRIYCDVLVGTEVADGIIVVIPPHRGSATVTFTLHGRHTYSEGEVARGRGYVEYLVTTAVATTETVLARPLVLAEFRTDARTRMEFLDLLHLGRRGRVFRKGPGNGIDVEH